MTNIKRAALGLVGSAAMFALVASALAAPITFTFEEGNNGTPGGIEHGSPQGLPPLIRDGFTIDVALNGPANDQSHFHELDSFANVTVPDRPFSDRGVLVRDGLSNRDPLFFTPSIPKSLFSLNSLLVGGISAGGSTTTGVQVKAFRSGNLLSTVVLPTPPNGFATYDAAALGELPGLAIDRLEFIGQAISPSSNFMLDNVVFHERPSVLTLAALAKDAYGVGGGFGGFTRVDATAPIIGPSHVYKGFQAFAYKKDDNIVVAVRGTQLSSIPSAAKNLLADASFPTSTPTKELTDYVTAAAEFLKRVQDANRGATITLTGHSLGGGIAQLLGAKTFLRTVTFDAPGPAKLYGSLSGALSILPPVITAPTTPRDIINYRLYGDAVSGVGTQMGTVKTVDAGGSRALIDLLNPFNFLHFHDMGLLERQIAGGASEFDGSPGSPVIKLGGNYFLPTATTSARWSVSFRVGAAITRILLDPPPGVAYELLTDDGSLLFDGIGLPMLDGISQWRLNYLVGDTWSSDQIVAAANELLFGFDVNGVRFVPLDTNGNAVFNPAPFSIGLAFGHEGVFDGRLLIERGDVREPSILTLLLFALLIPRRTVGWTRWRRT